MSYRQPKFYKTTMSTLKSQLLRFPTMALITLRYSSRKSHLLCYYLKIGIINLLIKILLLYS